MTIDEQADNSYKIGLMHFRIIFSPKLLKVWREQDLNPGPGPDPFDDYLGPKNLR